MMLFVSESAEPPWMSLIDLSRSGVSTGEPSCDCVCCRTARSCSTIVAGLGGWTVPPGVDVSGAAAAASVAAACASSSIFLRLTGPGFVTPAGLGGRPLVVVDVVAVTFARLETPVLVERDEDGAGNGVSADEEAAALCCDCERVTGDAWMGGGVGSGGGVSPR